MGCAFDGPDLDSTGSIVAEWTARDRYSLKVKQRKCKRRTVRFSSLNTA